MSTILSQYGIDHIYTDKNVDENTVYEIYQDSLSIFEKNKKHIEDLTNIYIGNQLAGIPDTNQNTNEKVCVNYTKIFIDTVVSITLNKALSYTSRRTEQEFKDDVDKIVAYMNDESEHAYNIATCTDMVVNGIGYQYLLEQKIGDPNPNSPFMLGRFSPESTFVVESVDIGNKVKVSYHIANIIRDKKTIERITAFDDKYKYVIENGVLMPQGEYVDETTGEIKVSKRLAHDLPYNPIQVFENDIYRLSIVQDLIGLQDTLNIAVSNYNNDILMKINQILLVLGAQLDDNAITTLKEKNILNLSDVNAKAEFIASQLDNKVIDYIKDVIEMMCLISGCPSQQTGRAETGTAVETQNGHTIANFNSNRREQSFYKPKRQQLDNIIRILRRNGQLKSDIIANDIAIKFDRNRLTSITENVNNLVTLINNNVDPYDALEVCPIFEDNAKVSKGIIELKAKERENAKIQENSVS